MINYAIKGERRTLIDHLNLLFVKSYDVLRKEKS